MDRDVNQGGPLPDEASGRRRISPGRDGARAGRSGVSPGEPLYGALDLGTNNCRLLLAAPSPGGFRVVDAFSRIVRLGEGAGRSGQLNEAAMRRTIAALRVCANKLRWWNVDRHRLIATEACRMAENGPAFLDRVEDELGLRLEIIDRHTEARLAVAGASPLIDPTARDVLLFDIGGGSTELSWVSLAGGANTIEAWTSMPAGVVTIAERFGGEEVSAETFEAMCAYVRPMVRAFAGQLAAAAPHRTPDHILGTSGTVTTICGVHLDLRRYDRSRVDGCWLARDDIHRVTGALRAMPYGERVRHPCIGHERADLVLAGCAILIEIIEAFPAERVRVADRGLREGILADLMAEDGAHGRPR